MIARHTIIRVQTLSQSEYNRSKHIPSANPSKKPVSELEDTTEVHPTPLPIHSALHDSRLSESAYRHSVLASAEKSEIHKRSHRMREFDPSSPGNESYLAKELQIKNEDLEEFRQENQHLRLEVQQLREEREYMIRDLQQRASVQNGNAELERHIGLLEAENGRLREDVRHISVLEAENGRLREDIGRIQLNQSGFAEERHENEELRTTISKVLAERDYFDTQLKQAKTIQISLEQELRQKADERNKLFSDYEVKITSLQQEIAGYRAQKEGDNLRQSQMLGKMQVENSDLNNEVVRLRQQKIDLETLVESLRKEKLNVDNNVGLRLAELEAANNSNINLLDLERRSVQGLRVTLQQREHELAVKESEILSLTEQKVKLQNSQAQQSNINPMLVLYMAEIDRLQNLVAERTAEIDSQRLKQSQEIESVKIMSESRLRDSLKSEMLQVTSQLQNERTQTQQELANLRRMIVEYEAKIINLTEELDKANKRGGFDLSSPSLLKPHQERDIYWDDSRRKSETGKRSGYGGLLDVDDLLRSPERGGDRAALESQLQALKLSVEEHERKEVTLVVEIEKLGVTINELQREKENKVKEWKNNCETLQRELEEQVKKKEELENKVVLLGSELGRLEQVINSLKVEKTEWQNKYQEAAHNLDILKMDLERGNRDLADEEVHKVTLRFGQERENLDRQLHDTQQKNYLLVEEVERLQILIAEKDRDIDGVRDEYESMLKNKLDTEVKEKSGQWQTEKRNLETELKGVTQRYRELEGNVASLHEENVRLHDKLNAANSQLDQQNRNLDQLQLRNSLYIQELKSEVSVQLTSEFELRIRELTEKFGLERSGLDDQIRKLKGRILELEVQLQDRERQVNRLSDDAMGHVGELEMLRNRYDELEKNSANSLQDLAQKLEFKRNQDIEEVVKKAGTQHQNERSGLETNLTRAQERIMVLENKVGQLEAENKRLIEERTRTMIEIEELRDANNRANSQYQAEKIGYEGRYSTINQRVQEYERQINLLKEEISDLRRANATYENDLHGLRTTSVSSSSQWATEKSTLESQRKALGEQVESLGKQVMMLNAEIERLVSAGNKQSKELEEYRRRCESQEREAQNSLEQLKWQLESKSRKEREEYEANSRQNYEQYKADYESSLRKAQRDNSELEKRMRQAETEVERLELQLKSKSEEVRELRERIVIIENLKNQEISRMREQFDIEKRDLENAAFSEKLEAERGHLNAKIKELKQKITELENRNTYVTVELEKQNSMYRNKSKEVEAWQEKYNKLESTRFIDIDQMKSQVEILKRSSLQINDYEVRFKAERAAYEAQILQEKQRREELEARVRELSSENERINSLYIERKREIDSLRSQQGKVDVGFHRELESLKKENESLKREKFDFNAIKVKLEVEKKAYENEISQLQHAVNAKKIEIAKLYDLIDTRRVESENLAQELIEAREEIAKNLKYCKELEAEYLELNSKYDQVIKEAGDLQRSREMYRSQIDSNQRELAKRNRELIHKIHEVDSLKSRYEEAYAAVEPIGTMGTMGTMSSKVMTRMSGVDHLNIK